MPRYKRPALNPLLPDFKVIETLTAQGETEFTVLLDSFQSIPGMNAKALKNVLKRLKEQGRISVSRMKGRSFYDLAEPPSAAIVPRRSLPTVRPLTPQYMARAGIATAGLQERR